MENEELAKLREDWYSDDGIQWQLVLNLRGKELAILNQKDTLPEIKVRYLKAFHSKFLKEHYEVYRIKERINANLYNSLATYSYFPTLSYSPYNRTTGEEYEKFKDEFEKHIVGYDILFDLDNLNIEDAYHDAKKLKAILDEKKIAFTCYFSGGKGFHFKIPFEFTGLKPKVFDVEFKIKVANFITYIKEIHEIESIDTSIVDLKRIAKLPYSLVNDNVVLPLSDEQFDNFNVEMIKIDKIPPLSCRNRGLLLRFHSLSLSELQNNFKKFFQEYQE